MRDETQHAFSPTVLRERADRLDALTSNGTPHMDGTSTVPWSKYADRPGQVNVVVPGHIAADLRATASSDRLLADLLDAFEVQPTDNDGQDVLDRIAAVLEARREQ